MIDLRSSPQVREKHRAAMASHWANPTWKAEQIRKRREKKLKEGEESLASINLLTKESPELLGTRVAMLHAANSVRQLQKIPQGDQDEIQALKYVLEWVIKRLGGRQ